MTKRFRFALCAALLAGISTIAQAQETPLTRLTVDSIYGSRYFASERFGPVRWLGDGSSYTTLESADSGAGREIVRYDTETGQRIVFVSASELTPTRDSVPLAIRSYVWSDELERVLIFNNSQRVWRQNTRGDY